MDFGVKLMSQLGGVVSSDVVQWLGVAVGVGVLQSGWLIHCILCKDPS